MDLTSWLKTGKIKKRFPSGPGLPDPNEEKSEVEANCVQAANDAVDAILLKTPTKRKRGEYSAYDDETRVKIARYAVDNGVARAARKFSGHLEHKVAESTVRSIRDIYIKQKKEGKVDTSSPSLPKSPRGNPLLLGETLDNEVQNWVKKLWVNGGVINARIVMAGAEAIDQKNARYKLAKYGGHINITKYFAVSLLRRMGFVKRKGTKSVKQLPTDFDEIKKKYVEKVSNVVTKFQIPDSLIINWDQTGCQLIPGGDWTMDQKGAQQVSITGLDDKRQITLLLAITKSGSLLSPQLIYAGKSDRCLPKGVDFPSSWDITYTESHWSNEESVVRFVENIIIPYVNGIRESLPFSKCNQEAVTIFGVYKAHQSPKLLELLKQNKIIPLFVPAYCTDKLQPLDLAVNREYKEILKGHFHDWYTEKVCDDTESTIVDLRTSVVKPIHASWVISTHEAMEEKKVLIRKGFEKAGLV